MRAAWRHLNQSLESRPAWQEALIVGVSVAIAIAAFTVAEGRGLAGVVERVALSGVSSAVGARIARSIRDRRPERDLSAP
ncbi:MAG TPA: hypothetical protein VIH92_10240 [Solirubrobacteraceae bacterium]|jgi:hypothetical protein